MSLILSPWTWSEKHRLSKNDFYTFIMSQNVPSTLVIVLNPCITCTKLRPQNSILCRHEFDCCHLPVTILMTGYRTKSRNYWIGSIFSKLQVSLELCKILLFLANKFDIDNFTVCRMSAIKELVLANPEEVAGYLTHEFYEEEYCLQHRIDMLDALTGAAIVMSSAHKEYREVNTRLLQNDPESGHTPQDWREVVDRRIEEKTRRFGKVVFFMQ